MKQVTLQVNGMSCQHCIHSIEGALMQLGASGQVDLKGNSVTVKYDETKVTLEAVKEAIEEQGYDIA